MIHSREEKKKGKEKKNSRIKLHLSFSHQWFWKRPLSSLVPPPGVPGFQRVGPVRHQVHAERDLQPAAVAAEVAAVRHGGRGGGEQLFPVSTSNLDSLSTFFFVG